MAISRVLSARRSTPNNKLFSKDFITGFLLGLSIAFFLMLVVKPILMPSPAVAPANDTYTKSIDR